MQQRPMRELPSVRPNADVGQDDARIATGMLGQRTKQRRRGSGIAARAEASADCKTVWPRTRWDRPQRPYPTCSLGTREADQMPNERTVVCPRTASCLQIRRPVRRAQPTHRMSYFPNRRIGLLRDEYAGPGKEYLPAAFSGRRIAQQTRAKG